MIVPYNRGPAYLTFYDRKEKPFSGTPEEYEALHGILSGYRNGSTDTLVLVNKYGEIAARGTVES